MSPAAPAAAGQCPALSAIALVALVSLAACGGGGGAADVGAPVSGPVSCPALPAGSSTLALDGLLVGGLSADKAWLSAMMSADYLWPQEIPFVDATSPPFSDASRSWESMENYFQALLTPRLDDQGRAKDRFSFAYPTQAWQKLATEGVNVGFGAEWRLSSPTPPRRVQVAYVMPGSPADLAGLKRGDRVMSVNGVSTDVNTEAGIAHLVGALYPQSACRTTFELSREGLTLAPVDLTAGEVRRTATLATRVLTVEGGRQVGYVAFLEHFGDAEARMTEAFAQFQQARVDDLVLDLRYNGGGYLYIASQVAHMVTSPERVRSKDFERLRYNPSRSAETASSYLPFLSTACLPDAEGTCSSSAPLPQLGLSRLYVLTSEATCSASEAIVNGLRGVDVDVILIGGRTCGKPYGFTAKERSGISYFPIEFIGVNHKGEGDYAYGFEATCSTPDDLAHELGDTREGLLATALAHRSTGRCPVGTTSPSAQAPGSGLRLGLPGMRRAVQGIGLRSPKTDQMLAGREERRAAR